MTGFLTPQIRDGLRIFDFMTYRSSIASRLRELGRKEATENEIIAAEKEEEKTVTQQEQDEDKLQRALLIREYRQRADIFVKKFCDGKPQTCEADVRTKGVNIKTARLDEQGYEVVSVLARTMLQKYDDSTDLDALLEMGDEEIKQTYESKKSSQSSPKVEFNMRDFVFEESSIKRYESGKVNYGTLSKPAQITIGGQSFTIPQGTVVYFYEDGSLLTLRCPADGKAFNLKTSETTYRARVHGLRFFNNRLLVFYSVNAVSISAFGQNFKTYYVELNEEGKICAFMLPEKTTIKSGGLEMDLPLYTIFDLTYDRKNLRYMSLDEGASIKLNGRSLLEVSKGSAFLVEFKPGTDSISLENIKDVRVRFSSEGVKLNGREVEKKEVKEGKKFIISSGQLVPASETVKPENERLAAPIPGLVYNIGEEVPTEKREDFFKDLFERKPEDVVLVVGAYYCVGCHTLEEADFWGRYAKANPGKKVYFYEAHDPMSGEEGYIHGHFEYDKKIFDLMVLRYKIPSHFPQIISFENDKPVVWRWSGREDIQIPGDMLQVMSRPDSPQRMTVPMGHY